MSMRFLKLRGNLYQFRRDIPKALRPAFGGKTMIVLPLHTGDVRDAKKRRDELVKDTDRQFALAVRGQLKPDHSAHIEQLAEAWKRELRLYEEDSLEWNRRIALGYEVDHDEIDPYSIIEEDAERISREHGEQAKARFEALIAGSTPIDDYLETHLSNAPIAEKTKMERRAAVKEFVDWCGQHRIASVNDVSPRHAGDYVDEVLQPMNHKTASKRLSNLRTYWEAMIKRGRATKPSPWDGVKVEPPTARDKMLDMASQERPFSDDEMNTIFTALRNAGDEVTNRTGLVCLFGALSGMRINEICSLRVADVQDGCFRIRLGKTENALRSVPIHPVLSDLVSKFIEQADPQAPLIPGTGPDKSDPIGKAFGRFRQKVGVDEVIPGKRRSLVNFHSFRRWFVTKAEQADVPPHIISAVVGHAEGRKGVTLQRYSKGPSMDQYRACVESVQLPHVALQCASDLIARNMSMNHMRRPAGKLRQKPQDSLSHARSG